MVIKSPMAALLEDPARQDSEDFTQEQADQAIPTVDRDDFASQLLHQVQKGGYTLCAQDHELRRWKGRMYCRARFLGSCDKPDKTLIFQIDWVQP